MAEKTVKAKNISSVNFHSQLGIIKPGAIGNITLSESQNHIAKLEVVEVANKAQEKPENVTTQVTSAAEKQPAK